MSGNTAASLEHDGDAGTSEEASVTASELEEHDGHVAQAAFLLWMENLDFDWTQLSPAQKEIYHGMVGRYMQSLEDND